MNKKDREKMIDETKKGANSEVHIDPKIQLAYDALRAKQLSYDNLMWQTPLLCITAQSFLYNVALTSANSIYSKSVSALLAVMLGLAAIQLMAKHRHHETNASKWLERIENQNNLEKVHARPPKATGWFSRIMNIPSYGIWIGSLTIVTLFGIALSYHYLKNINWLEFLNKIQ